MLEYESIPTQSDSNRPIPHRIGFVDRLYYSTQESIESFDWRGTHEVVSTEQPFVRRSSVGADRESVPTGWVSGCSLVVLENRGRGPITVNPTPREAEEDRRRVLEVFLRSGDDLPLLIVPSLQRIRLWVDDPSELSIRSRFGETQYTCIMVQA